MAFLTCDIPTSFLKELTRRGGPYGYSVSSVRIDDLAEVETKLAESLAHPGPVLIDAVVNHMELAIWQKTSRSTSLRR